MTRYMVRRSVICVLEVHGSQSQSVQAHCHVVLAVGSQGRRGGFVCLPAINRLCNHRLADWSRRAFELPHGALETLKLRRWGTLNWSHHNSSANHSPPEVGARLPNFLVPADQIHLRFCA